MMKKKGKNNSRKHQLDEKRTEWRKRHRTLNGRVILYPENPPEHINARGSKLYNWFWKKMLLEIDLYDIPAVIASIQDQINAEQDTNRIRMYRTMIGMAQDAYQLKKLDEIKDVDTELMLDNTPVFNAETGVIYRKGVRYTTDYNEDETGILIRDIEGLLLDVLSSDSSPKEGVDTDLRNDVYKTWEYMEKT